MTATEEKQLAETKWELEILMASNLKCKLEGRNLEYGDEQRIKALRVRLDRLLGLLPAEET